MAESPPSMPSGAAFVMSAMGSATPAVKKGGGGGEDEKKSLGVVGEVDK